MQFAGTSHTEECILYYFPIVQVTGLDCISHKTLPEDLTFRPTRAVPVLRTVEVF